MKKILNIVLGFIVLFSSCKDFDDINIDPSKLSSAPTKSLLTYSLQRVSNPIWGRGDSVAYEQHGNYYVQYLSEGPYPGSSLYNVRNTNWDVYFVRPLNNLQTIINYNTEDNPLADPGINGSKNNQIAVARILKAYYFWTMTDRYGDIPYSEALKGNGNFTPKYDQQKDIYYDLFKELKEAAAQINESEQGVSGDILLGGDMAAWKKFANTTRLYMALRLIKNDYAKGQQEFTDALSSGVLASNADNVVYQFIAGDPNNYNPWFIDYSVDNRNDYAVSTTLTNYMQPKGDPRLPLYAEVLPGNVIKGLPYGSSAPLNIPLAYSRIGSYFRSAGSPAFIYTYPQTLFTLAEAAKVGYIPGGDAQAATYYADAIKASFEMYGVLGDATPYTAYMSQPGVAYNPATGLQQIITEKWVHQYLNGFESWTDWRRTGFPVLTPAEDAVQADIPRRMGYPVTEPSINNESYQEAVARQGPDDTNTRMWWDK